MAPVARFATFVMMPALFIFTTNNEQLTIISTFVEVCGGVAVDVLFGRKLAQLCALEQKQVRDSNGSVYLLVLYRLASFF